MMPFWTCDFSLAAAKTWYISGLVNGEVGGGCRSTHILKNQEDGLFGLLRNECKVGILNLEFLWSDIISRTMALSPLEISLFHFTL